MTLGANTLAFEVTANVDDLIRNTKRGGDESERNLKKVEKALEGVEDAAKVTADEVAEALKAESADLVAELHAAEKAAKAVAIELGDASDVDPVEAIAKFRKFGLELDDIEANAEQLVAALRSVDDVKAVRANSEFRNLGKAVSDVDTDTGRARDTMNGFIGDAVTELPGIGPALGPANEGMSQLVEGLLEGEVGIGSFLTTAGAMAGVATIVGGLTAAWSNYREEQDRREENIRKATEALLEQAGAVETLDEAIEGLAERDAGEGGVVAAVLGNLEEGQADRLSAALVDLGLTYDDLFSAIGENGTDLSTLFADALGRTTDLSEDAIDRLVTLISASEGAGGALLNLNLAGFGDEITPEAADEITRIAKSLEELDDAVDETDLDASLAAALNEITARGGQASEVLDAIRRSHPTANDLEVYVLFQERMADINAENEIAAESTETLTREQWLAQEAMEANTVAASNEAAALDNVTEAADEATESINGIKESFAEFSEGLGERRSYLLIQDDLDELREKGQAAFEAAESGAEDAEAKARDYELAQIGLIDRVISYADEIGNVPDEKVSEIIALVEAGEIDEVIGKLAELERTRTATLRVTLQQDGTVRLPGGYTVRDRGGPLAAGESAIVAERRPEFVNGELVTSPSLVTGPAQITSGQQTAAMLAPTGPPTNVYMTFTAPMRPDDIAELQRRFDQRNGRY